MGLASRVTGMWFTHSGQAVPRVQYPLKPPFTAPVSGVVKVIFETFFHVLRTVLGSITLFLKIFLFVCALSILRREFMDRSHLL